MKLHTISVMRTAAKENYCLEKFVLKGWILNILRQILDECGKYSLVKETDVSGIVDKIYQCLDKKLLDDAVRKKGFIIIHTD